MRISRYTFIFDIENKDFFVYNTLTNSLIEVDEESYNLLKNAPKDFELSEMKIDDELSEALITNGVISESDDDDYLKYKSVILNQRAQKDGMHLTLAPTMDCCFNCYYCFEKYKEKNYMSSEMIDAIVKYMKAQTEVNHLKLTWFGGEPLMALPQMEEFYDKLTKVWTKSIQSNIITTGYHINPEAVRVMKKIGISNVQITLDGLKDTHNKIKYLPSGEDVFSKIWDNIRTLNDLAADDIHVVIRVNLTKQNADEYEQLYKLFIESFRGRKNLSMAPAFVSDRGSSEMDSCDKKCTLFSHSERSECIINFANKGIDSPFLKYPEPAFNECAVRNKVAISFDPEGYAYKCWEVIGNKEYAIGKLNSDGVIKDVNVKVLNRQLYGADTIDDPACMKCKYLPICNGGCPIQRIQNKFEGWNNNVCTYYKGYMENFLKMHIVNKKLSEKNAEEKSV